MVYSNQFVAVVKNDGQILRDTNGVVHLPFNSEFTILLKNTSARKARVGVFIDGKDVLSGHRLLISPNSSHELMGFMDSSGSAVTKRFRWINKTQNITDHRGDFIDDGFIRVEYEFENVQEVHVTHHYRHESPRLKPPSKPRPTWDRYESDIFHTSGPIIKDTIISSDHTSNVADGQWKGEGESSLHEKTNQSLGFSASYDGSRGRAVNCSLSSPKVNRAIPNPEEGITVAGSNTHVPYSHGHIGSTGPKQSIVIRLQGSTSTGTTITEPITVRSVVDCLTCGRSNSSNANFCIECGTNLR